MALPPGIINPFFHFFRNLIFFATGYNQSLFFHFCRNLIFCRTFHLHSAWDFSLSIVFFCSLHCIFLSFLCCFACCEKGFGENLSISSKAISSMAVSSLFCPSSTFCSTSSPASSTFTSISSPTVPAVGESPQLLPAISPRPSAQIRCFFHVSCDRKCDNNSTCLKQIKF